MAAPALLMVRVPPWTGVAVPAREPGTVDLRGWTEGGRPRVVLGPGVAARMRPSGCLAVGGLRVSGAGR